MDRAAYVLQVLEQVGDSFPFAIGQDRFVEAIARFVCSGGKVSLCAFQSGLRAAVPAQQDEQEAPMAAATALG